MPELKQKLGFDAKSAITNLGNLEKALEGVNTQLQNLNQNTQTGNLPKVSQGMKDTGDKAKKASRGVGSFFASFLAYKVVGFATQQIKDAILSYKEFGLKIAEVQTITGEWEISNQRLGASIRDISNDLGVAASTVAEGLYQTLSNQVVDAEQALQLLAKAQKLATITASKTEDAVNSVSSVMNAYGKSVIEADRVMDTLFKTIELGRLRLEDIADILGRVTPLTSQMGVSWEETAAAIATMTRQGVRADTAVTQLRAIMQKIIKPTEEMTALFRRWGVKDGPDAIRTFGGLRGVLLKMSNEVGGSNAEMAEFFRRVRAIVGQMSLLNDGGELFAETMKEIEESTGAADEAFKGFQENEAYKLEKSWQQFKNTMIAFGETVTPILNYAIEATVLWAQRMQELDNFIGDALGLTSDELRQLREDFKKAEKDAAGFTVDTPEHMEKNWKEAAQRAAQSLLPLKKEMLEMEENMEGLLKVNDKVFKGFIKNLHDSYKEAFKGLDDIVKNAAKIEKDSIKNIQGIKDKADDRKYQDRLTHARSEWQERKIRASRYMKFENKVFQHAHKRRITEEGLVKANADADYAERIANELKLDAQKRGNRQDEARWNGRLRAIDNYRTKLQQKRSATAQADARVAVDLRSQLDAQADSVKEVTQQIEEQLKKRQELVAKGGPSARAGIEEIDQFIDKLKGQLKGFRFTEEQKNLLKQFDIRPEELDRINNLITEGLDVKVENMIVDMQNIQKQFDEFEFQIQARIGLRGGLREEASTALNIDTQGLGPIEAREKLTKEARKLVDADSEENAILNENARKMDDIRESLAKAFAPLEDGKRSLKDLQGDLSEYASSWDIYWAATLKSLGFEKAARKSLQNEQAKYIKGYLETDFSREKAYNKLAKTGQAFYRRMFVENKTVTDAELSAYQSRIAASKDLTIEERKRLNEGLDKLGQVNQWLRQNEKATKDRGLTDYQATVAKELLDLEKEGLPTQKQQNENLKKATDERAKARQELNLTNVELDKGKSKVVNLAAATSNIREGYVQANTTAETLNSVVVNSVPQVNKLTDAVNKLADAWKRIGDEAGGGDTQTAKFGRFFQHGGYFNYGGRGTDTIPAMLSQGETVVNKRSSARFFSQLNAMNQGSQPVYREQGGPVTNVGDINVSVNGGDSSQQTVREIGRQLQREIKRGTIKLS
jgi:TP901 family phage tail tape measure protein